MCGGYGVVFTESYIGFLGVNGVNGLRRNTYVGRVKPSRS